MRHSIALALSLLAANQEAASAMERCQVGSVEGRCGAIQVPEDRGVSGGRQLEIFVAVVPARGEDTETDPIVILEGGPGASVSHFAALHVQTFGAAGRQRDLVLIDQRGTGRSAPLDCDAVEDFGTLPTEAGTAACLDTLRASADPAHYTTDDAVGDLLQVLDELGYERANFFATSNGTRTALRLLARHPERVRSVIMLAPYPTTHNALVESGETMDRALEQMAKACREDATCHASYPKLEAASDRIRARHGADSRWSEFTAGIRMMLFFPLQASRVPQLLDMVDRADRLPEPTPGPQDSLLNDWISRGAFLSILCSEDAARTSLEEVRRRNVDTYLGPGWAESIVSSCEQWPRKDLPNDFGEPVSSEVPALLLVGGLDPAMPPSWSHEIASTLPNARVVEIPQGQHSLIGMSGAQCVLRLLTDFLVAGSAASLDPSCAEDMRRPPFAPPA